MGGLGIVASMVVILNMLESCYYEDTWWCSSCVPVEASLHKPCDRDRKIGLYCSRRHELRKEEINRFYHKSGYRLSPAGLWRWGVKAFASLQAIMYNLYMAEMASRQTTDRHGQKNL